MDHNTLASLFKSLGESNRMAILDHLCKCSGRGETELTVSEIGTCCDIDLSVVSRHLGKLKESGVLTAEKKGKEVYYSVNAKSMARALRKLADTIESCCGPGGCHDKGKC